MRRPLVIYDSEFPYIWGTFVFLFYQCTCRRERRKTERGRVCKHLALTVYESSKSKDDITVWASLHLFILGIFLSHSHQPESVNCIFVGKINSAGCLYRGVNLPKVRAYTLFKICRKVAEDFLQQFYFLFCEGIDGILWRTSGLQQQDCIRFFCLMAE